MENTFRNYSIFKENKLFSINFRELIYYLPACLLIYFTYIISLNSSCVNLLSLLLGLNCTDAIAQQNLSPIKHSPL